MFRALQDDRVVIETCKSNVVAQELKRSNSVAQIVHWLKSAFIYCGKINLAAHILEISGGQETR